MNHYTSQVEFEWLEIVEPITEQDSGRVTVSEEKSIELSAIYQSNKPFVKDDDIYQFIGANISQNDNQVWGILNYRVNGEHLQFRF